MLERTLLYYRTLRHLKPVQVFGRVLPEIKRRLMTAGFVAVTLPEVPSAIVGRLRPQTPFHYHDPWNTTSDLVNGVFCFLEERSELGWPPRWTDESRPILWNYNLHYFSYLHLLRPEQKIELCKAWIDCNPVGRTVGWYPYPLSLRIVNWCKANISDKTINESLYHQAYFLSRNLETYHPGNHLLENAKALIIAARYFEGSEHARSWMEEGLGIMKRELPLQVLEDGGYFERSPMYHAIMLEGLLDVCNVLPVEHPDRSMLCAAAERMSDFLLSTTHPDGQIALFNDSAQEIAKSTASLIDYARRVLGYQPAHRCDFDESGYYVYAEGRIFLIIDGGPVGPDFIPAHAHADIFSFEFSVDGKQFIVDSGTFDYVPGGFRTQLRGTRAHNTVCVDDVDQVECWKSHRVARRFTPKDVAVERDGRTWTFSGVYDGYATLIGDSIVHKRRLSVTAEGNEISCIDTLDGTGCHIVEARLHFHPAVKLRWHASDLVAERAGTILRITGDFDGARLVPAFYCPKFGVKIANTALVFGGKRQLPAQLRFSIDLRDG